MQRLHPLRTWLGIPLTVGLTAADFARHFNNDRTRGIELTDFQADEILTFTQKALPDWVFTSMEVFSRF